MNTEVLLKALKPMMHSRVRNYATPGLTSSLIGGEGHGKVRLFLSDRDTREWITPHSHRFDFTCLVLRGSVENILFKRATYYGYPGSNLYMTATVRPQNGGLGGYEIARGGMAEPWTEEASTYKEGDTYSMTSRQIHSIRFSRDAIVLFLEGPEVVDTSVVLEPYSNDELVPTFATAPWMFKRVVPAEALGPEQQ